MDPLSLLSGLVGAIKNLCEIAAVVKENREQCLKLCLHINSVLDVLQEECRNGVSQRLERRILKLSNALTDLITTLEGLHKSSFLQRIIWRDQVAKKIQELYRYLFEAVQDLKLGMAFDVSQVQKENEEARRKDAAEAKDHFDQLLRDNREILNELEVQKQHMQEAIMSLHHYLAQLPDSGEKRYLENGMHALQRRSGPLRLAPDVSVITSLDVIIHYDRKLGEGGFTSVYEAHWKGTKVAVKVMGKGVPASAIQREVDVWKRLRHPHILEFFGACSIADPPFMVCAYKENGDAVEYLRRTPDANRRQLLYEASLGLVYLHQNGVIHGDLKASNILIDKHGKACLSDFGLSQIKLHTTSIRWPGSGPPHGTARWMSPEHMTQGITNKRTDVYSFGMTMYEVFTGFPPFAGTPEAMLLPVICDRAIRPARPDDPSVERKGLTEEVWELICRTWSHHPYERPTASEIAAHMTRHAAMIRYDAEGRRGSMEAVIPTQNSVSHGKSISVASSECEISELKTPLAPTPAHAILESQVSRQRSASASSGLTLEKSPLAPPSNTLALPTLPSPKHQRHYISRSAQELVDFLDEGPPDLDQPEDRRPMTTVLKPAARLRQIPGRLRKLSKKQQSPPDPIRLAKVPPDLNPNQRGLRRKVSEDIRDLVDFLDAGPPEADESDPPSSPMPQNSSSFLGRLQGTARTGWRTHPKDVLPDDGPSSPNSPPAPQTPGSPESDRSQPYISKGARDFIQFLGELDDGPTRRRARDGSIASANSSKSNLSPVKRLRGMISKTVAARDSTGSDPLSDEERLLSRRSSMSSLGMFALPLPTRNDGPDSEREESKNIGPMTSKSRDAMQSGLIAPGGLSSSVVLSDENAPLPSSPPPTSEQRQDPAEHQLPTSNGGSRSLHDVPERVQLAAGVPVVLLLTSLALYMLLSTPFG